MLMLDPRIPLPARSAELARAGTQWAPLVEWSSDPRVRLGLRVRDEVEVFYASTFCVESSDWCPRPLVRVLHEIFGRMLESTPLGAPDDAAPAEFSPPYAEARVGHRAALAGDVARAIATPGLAIAAGVGSWGPAVTSVDVGIAGVGPISLVRRPNEPSAAEIRSQRHARWSSGRCVIVGGQMDRGVVATLAAETGLPTSEIQWIASELHKPPRALDKRLGGFNRPNDIVVVLIGKIGHATSAVARATCGASGGVYLEVESGGHVVTELIRALDRMA